MNLQITYFPFHYVLQSGEASFPSLSLSCSHSVNTQNIEEHLIPLDSDLLGQHLLQNFKMSFTDFLSILL